MPSSHNNQNTVDLKHTKYQRDLANVYDGPFYCDDEPIPLNCSANVSLSLEPLLFWMEPPVCGYQSFQSECFKSSLANECSELSLIGTLAQNYSSDIKANGIFIRAKSARLPATIPPARAGRLATSSPCGPNENDVVCSRGKIFYTLPGNVRFRKTIHAHIPVYLAASSKMDKSGVIDRIIDSTMTVNTIDGPSRFLKYQSRTRTWSVMGHDQVRDKVGHALREAIYDKERESKIKSTSVSKRLTKW